MTAGQVTFMLFIAAVLIYVLIRGRSKKAVVTAEMIVKSEGELAAIELATQVVDEKDEVRLMTMEELLEEGLTPQQARQELRAQRRDIREQQDTQRRSAAAVRRTLREKEAAAANVRKEELARQRAANQNIRTGLAIAKAIGRSFK